MASLTPAQHASLSSLVALAAGEALFRPSSSPRWMACRGSVRLSAGVRERTTSRYAEEGTAAHKVLETALRGERQPDEWTDRQVRLDDTGMRGWFVDAEMAECVEWAANEVRKFRVDDPEWELLLEHPLSLAPLDPADPLLAQNRGTGDVVLVHRRLRRAAIMDLKYGRGVKVPQDSPQLKNYLLMVAVSLDVPGGWDAVGTRVLQPRVPGGMDDVDVAWFDPNELLTDFLGTLVEAMEGALEPDAPLVPGPHCRWCPAKASCPALRAEALSIAEEASSAPVLVSNAAALPAIVEPTSPPDPRMLTPQQVASILDRRPSYDAFIEAVEELASRMLESGVDVPGWDLKPRTGNRRYRGTQEETVAGLVALGLKRDDLFTPPKLKSPAQVEKMLPAAKRPLVNSLVERPQGELQLVRSGTAGALGTRRTALGAIPADAR